LNLTLIILVEYGNSYKYVTDCVLLSDIDYLTLSKRERYLKRISLFRRKIKDKLKEKYKRFLLRKWQVVKKNHYIVGVIASKKFRRCEAKIVGGRIELIELDYR